MKISTKLFICLGVALGLHTYNLAQTPVAVAVTCKTTQPGAKRPQYIALANNCGEQQAACDQYKDDPFYGPATPIKCDPYYNMKKLQGIATKWFVKDNRLYPGSETPVTLCKTKSEGKIFGVISQSCDPAEQKKTCNHFAADIADPVSCKVYSSVDWAESILNANPMRYGLECQLGDPARGGSAVPMRLQVPDCSQKLKDELCPPGKGTVNECKEWPDTNALKKWAGSIPIGGKLWCTLNDLPAKTVGPLPIDTCDNPESQRKGCGTWGKPAKCEKWDVEGLRQKAEQQAKS